MGHQRSPRRAPLTSGPSLESGLPPAGSNDDLIVEPTVALSMRGRHRLALACSVLVVLMVTAYRFDAMSIARYPGHADPAFYYNVAENLAAGRGPTVNYVWQFLAGFPPLPHYAFDYWLPGTSLLMAAALKLNSAAPAISSALEVNVLMSLLLATGTYLLGRLLSRTWWVPPAATAVVIVQPNVSAFAAQAESSIYLSAFAVLAMSAAIAARQRPWLWLAAGVLGGMAHLSRSEGLLLVAVMAIAALGSSRTGRRMGAALMFATGYLLVMSPLFAVNLQRSGTPLPRSTTLTPFISTFENIYSLHVETSASTLFRGGPGEFLLDRMAALQQHLISAFGAFAPLDAVVMTALVVSALFQLRLAAARGPFFTWPRRALRSPWFIPIGFPVAVLSFWTLVAPRISSGGALTKCMAAMLPALVIGALTLLDRLALPGKATLAICVLLVAVPATEVAESTTGVLHRNNAIGSTAAELRPMLQSEQACLDRPVVLMTRNPWEISQATGFPTVQIPNAPLPEILQVAARYGVTHIELTPVRAALNNPTLLLRSRILTRSTHFGQRPIFRVRQAVDRPSC